MYFDYFHMEKHVHTLIWDNGRSYTSVGPRCLPSRLSTRCR